MAPVVVRAPGRLEARQIEGKIDSGADLCAIPESLIEDLDLAPVRIVRAAGFAGILQETMLYHCAIDIGNRRFEHIEALATRRPYAIIGRNVLRSLIVKLDGPSGILTITVPASSRLNRKSVR